MCMREQRYPVAIPAEVNPEPLNGQQSLAESALITIRVALNMFRDLRSEILPDEPRTLSELPRTTQPHRSMPFEQMHLCVAADGFSLRKITNGSLVDWYIRLDIPELGATQYERHPFNIDGQSVRPATKQCTDVQEIGKDPKAVIDVLSFERDIVRASIDGWEGWQPVRTIPKDRINTWRILQVQN